ncbi:MAG: glycosyltransferase family 2 protein [Bacteroidia bacterium]|jgi:glycosyltransferase involved in cell wall biosynthesis|nr:glycosyltransferase family 2 protein [Bacteroidia bacterium]
MSIHPFISVIIPTYNREKCLLDTLHSILQQTYPQFEIIVIDQSEIISEEKKHLIKKEPVKIRYFQTEDRGRSLAKNYGILQAKGDLILFCDDDILVDAGFLETHVNIYKIDPLIAAASCRLVEEGDPSRAVESPLRTTVYGKLVNKPWSTTSSYVSSLNGGNMSFKKEVLSKVGFFEEYFEGTSMVEEPDVAYRVIKSGYKIYFCADTTVKHFPQYNGNVAYMKEKRAEWFYFYFYNLLIFYTKYKRSINLPIVFVYTLLVCTKHIIIHKMPLSSYGKMFRGFFGGIKKGNEIYEVEKASPYFSNYRLPKQKIKQVHG